VQDSVAERAFANSAEAFCDSGELVQAHDSSDVFQSSHNKLAAIDINSL
jgi:hypothetical protein